MRSGVGQAQAAEKQAVGTSQQLGSEAQNIGSTLTPFLTSELNHPQGYGQQDESAMLSSALSGAGGADAGITGEANAEAARTRNAGGFQGALDEAARQRMKAAAGASEGIAAKNADLKQNQVQEAEHGLQGMYGTDTSGMLDAMGQESRDIDAATQANNSGWLQNMNEVLRTINQSGSAASSLKTAFGGG